MEVYKTTFLSRFTAGLLLMLVFMVKDCIMESPPPSGFEEPIIYVSFTRWENRTFSPRVYYLLLHRLGLKDKLLNSDSPPQLPAYAIRTPIAAGNNNRVDPTPDIDISSRLGFSGPKRKVKRPGSSTGNRVEEYADRIEQAQKTDVPQADEQNDSTVLFPSANPPRVISPDEFFSDRLAYPGMSNRRPAPRVPSSPDSSTTPQTLLTEDDSVETVGLTFDIMRVSNWQDENVVFSPLSISFVLAVLLLGADGVTHKEIASQLRRQSPFSTMDHDKELRFHTAFNNLLTILDSSSGDHVSLETFSHIFVDKKFSLSKKFQDNAINFYNARSQTFDFEKDGELFKEKVNEWIAFKTRGKIQTLVDSPPDSTTTFSLVNAVYFQGSWRSPFAPGITQMKPFHVSPTEIMEVPMMTNILEIPYSEENNFRVIGLPYKDNKTGLFIILPKNPGVKGLRELEQELTHESFKKLLSMRLTQVTVQMPKMRVESDGHIQEILSKLGMKTIFDQRYANFSRISDTDTDTGGLYIKSILHRAVMDVNERGTEAAAATIATGDRNLDERPVSFVVNQPFIFTIIQVKAKTVLFWGRVTRPQPLPE